MIITKPQIALHKFTHNTKTRHELSGVYTNGITAVATDSYSLVEITNKETGLVGGPPLILDAGVLKAQKLLKGQLGVPVSEGMYSRVSAQQFPKYEQIFDLVGDDAIEVAINGRYLADILKALAALNPNDRVMLRVSLSQKKYAPLEVRSEGDTHKGRALLMPIQH